MTTIFDWGRGIDKSIDSTPGSDCQLVPRQRFIFLGSRAIEHSVLGVSSEKRVKTCENMSYFPYLLRGKLSSAHPNSFLIGGKLKSIWKYIWREWGNIFGEKVYPPSKVLFQTPPVLTLFLEKPFAFSIFFESPINFAQTLLLELCNRFSFFVLRGCS